MNKVAQRSISWHEGVHIGGFSEDSGPGTPNNPLCPGAIEFHGKLLNNCSCYTEKGRVRNCTSYSYGCPIVCHPLTVFPTPANCICYTGKNARPFERRDERSDRSRGHAKFQQSSAVHSISQESADSGTERANHPGGSGDRIWGRISVWGYGYIGSGTGFEGNQADMQMERFSGRALVFRALETSAAPRRLSQTQHTRIVDVWPLCC
jgi:hypothetical protein